MQKANFATHVFLLSSCLGCVHGRFGTKISINGRYVVLEHESSKRESKRRASEQAIQLLMAFDQVRLDSTN